MRYLRRALSRLIANDASPAVIPVWNLHTGHTMGSVFCVGLGHRHFSIGLLLVRERSSFFAGSLAGYVCQSASRVTSFMRSGLHRCITSSADSNASFSELYVPRFLSTPTEEMDRTYSSSSFGVICSFSCLSRIIFKRFNSS